MRKVLPIFILILISCHASGQDPHWQSVNFPLRIGEIKLSADYDSIADLDYLVGDYFPACDSDTTDTDCLYETVASFNGQHFVTYGKFAGMIQDVARMHNRLYVAGNFDHVNDNPDTTKRFIVRQNGNNWESIGYFNNPISAMTADSNNIYVCGYFTQINNEPIKYLARYDGTTWHSIPDSEIYDPSLHDIQMYNGDLYVAGDFSYADSIKNMMYYHDGEWHGLGNNPSLFGIDVTRLTVWHNELYISGDFIMGTGEIHNHLLKWDGETVSAPWPTFYDFQGNSDTYGSGLVWMVPSTNYLYVCGSVQSIGNTEVDHVARYDGSQWCAMHTSNTTFPTASIFAYHDSLYAYLYYAFSGNDPPTGLYKWIGGDDVGPCSEAVTGTEEVLYRKLSVHPNPTHNEIYVDNLHGLVNYHLYDLLGRIVKEGKTSCSGQFKLDLTGITTGTYLLHIDGKTVNYSTKVVKE